MREQNWKSRKLRSAPLKRAILAICRLRCRATCKYCRAYRPNWRPYKEIWMARDNSDYILNLSVDNTKRDTEERVAGTQQSTRRKRLTKSWRTFACNWLMRVLSSQRIIPTSSDFGTRYQI